MTNTPAEYQGALEMLILWASQITVRQAAVENLLKQKLNLSFDEWMAAMHVAKDRLHPQVRPPSETVEGLEAHLQSLLGLF